MNGTPRLGSSYPSTPDSVKTQPWTQTSNGVSDTSKKQGLTYPKPKMPSKTTNEPLVPLSLVDAPSQRLYVFAIYIALLAWRLYDWGKLVEDEADSLWLFIKWVAMDAVVFLYALPALRIPWLEWSNLAIMSVFLVHAVLNGMLMFRIPIPLEAFLAGLVKIMYDREISVSENRVKPGNILQNSSLIMGKHIINILPEGSATLNADRKSFCIDNYHPFVKLPIQLNETMPIRLELLRIDFDTNTNETFEIKGKEMKTLVKQALKKHHKQQSSVLVLEYTVRKPGVYRLQKVIDDSDLEVQRHVFDTIVVNCPKATIRHSTSDKCIGDLSNLTVEVRGTPPMKIMYSRTINRDDQSFHFQSIQPENLVSPLLGSDSINSLIAGLEEDVSWGRSRSIDVRLNESMTTSGKWTYFIDEIHDATGNVANFSADGDDGDYANTKLFHLAHAFTVHERPVVMLKGCDTNYPLKVATGHSSPLPIELGSSASNFGDTRHTVAWYFSPLDKLTASGDHGEDVVVEEFISKNPCHRPEISRPGLYTLKSISSQFCDGEIKEPASCLLINPPEPDLLITSDNIYDKCAGNSIGLLVDLDLIGTPPFIVHYEIEKDRQRKSHKVRIDGSRHQLELKPSDAGHFTYRFKAMEDHVYGFHPLNAQILKLDQDVKPPASAYLMKASSEIFSCIEERVSIDVLFQGESPFTLEYELTHNGKRKREKVNGIQGKRVTISTEPLIQGGDYTLALTSVQDKTGCKIFLMDEAKIVVRQQRPKATFGLVDGKRKVTALEGDRVRLPLRLDGVPPLKLSYQRVNDSSGQVFTVIKQNTNDIIQVDQQGTYELLNISDSLCPGSVNPSTATFEVDWIPRPMIKFAEHAGVALVDNVYSKREVCEGDIDAVELSITGSPPYHLLYKQRHKSNQGSPSILKKEIDVALGVATISMDTTKSGLYTYEFSEVSDNFYNHDSRSKPLVLEQVVNPKPLAVFAKPGHSYTYCKAEEAGDEVIPIILEGVPPFALEIDIKHQSSLRPQAVNVPNILSNRYEFRIPHNVLSLGTHHVSVRKVRDSRGCERKMEYGAPNVQVQVFDVPTIYPLETRTDYCVGDRISYTLSGSPPFEVYYTFGDVQRKAKSPNTNFRRIAEKPGDFIITAVSDKASECKASVDIMKHIHEMPSVKISKGKQLKVDIHEGKEADILFEFWGTPPFEFTYTRSTNAKKGQKPRVLETRHDVSLEHSKVISSSQEGTYEVVAIKDKFCAFSTQRLEAKPGRKLLHP